MMKLSNIAKLMVLAISLSLASCGSEKKTEKETKTMSSADSLMQTDFLQKVHETASAKTEFVSSKLKFTVETGPQKPAHETQQCDPTATYGLRLCRSRSPGVYT